MKSYLIIRFRYVVPMLVAILCFLSMSPSMARRAEYQVPENEARTHYMLGIIAYNYTDNYIDQFSVDGQGGGNVRLSSETSGGSGTVCCILFPKKAKWPIQVHVKWQNGGCRVYDKDRRFGQNRNFFKEVTVNLEPGSSAQPSDIAVHFFKDGTVRVILSDGWEPPLFKLSENRAKEKHFPECRRDEPIQYL